MLLRRVLPCLVFVALLLPNARAEDAAGTEDARAIGRERLVLEARRVVQRSDLASLASAQGVVGDLRRTVRESQAIDGVSDYALDARLAWLLGGASESGEDPGASALAGALLQSVWLGEWLSGDEVGGDYALRPPAPEARDAETLVFSEAEWKAVDGGERRRLLSEFAIDLERLEDAGRQPPRQLALDATASLKDGEDAREVTIDPVRALRDPPFLENGRVLVYPNELEDEVSEMWLRARTAQVGVRVEAWSRERPSDLVSEGAVALLVGRVNALEAAQDRWQKLANTVQGALDAMVEQDLEVNRRVFALESDLQEAKGVEGADDPATEAGRTLVRLQLEELRARLEQTMLYLVVVRAQQRLDLYGRAVDHLQQERVVAGAVQDRYERRLRRVRRAAQLSRLQQDRAWCEANREQARRYIQDEAGPEEKVWQAYTGALDDLIAMNGTLSELVEIGQALEAHSDPSEDDETETPPSGAVQEPTATPHETAETTSEGDEPTEPAAPDAEGAKEDPEPPSPTETPAAPVDARRAQLGPLLEPENYVHRPGFVSGARAALKDPSFDADLVARTYAAADDYVLSRGQAIGASMQAESLEAEYEKREAHLVGALESVGPRLPAYMAWDLRQIEERREPYDELLQRTMKGIREGRSTAREQVNDLQALCRELTGLGARSLRIRANRSLDGAGLREARDEARAGIRHALGWLTGRTEPNLWSWLTARWPFVLLTLAAAFALGAAVTRGRRRIDAALDKLGRGVPILRDEGVSVASEAAEAREMRKHEKEAAAETEAAVLADAGRPKVEQGVAADAPPPVEDIEDDMESGGAR